MATPMTDRFWRALEDLFTGEEMEGSPSSGFIKLMHIKRAYFEKEVKPALKKTIEERTGNNTNFREELCERLHDFFSHYFCESGSIYFRHVPAWRKFYDRVYADGEDVALAWKTRDLYYVKSDTLVRSMQVRLPDTTTIYFDASEIEHKKNNERRDFVFEYSGKKDEGVRILARIKVSYSQNGRKTKMDEIMRKAREDDFNLTEDALQAAFKIFRRQTEADFFIHKNARRFLREQFDLWMHDFAFREENEFTAERFEQLQVLRNTARDVIDFIGQFEDELTRLWGKPKFARNVHYVVTADKLKPALRRKIAAHPAMKKQIAEWKELKKIKLPKFDASAFEKGDSAHKFLPIDTKHFSAELEKEIINSFENLAESLDGEFWKSENWQALNTLHKRYAGRIKCIYIDPPFNLGGSDQFAYRTNYKDSSWATMLENRLKLARAFLAENGGIFVRCDYNGNWMTRCLMNEIFGQDNFKNEIKVGKSARIVETINRYHNAHDSLYFYGKEQECDFSGVREKRENPKWLAMHLPGVRWSPIDSALVKMFSKENIRTENGAAKTRARIILGQELLPPDGRHWALSQEAILEREKQGRIRLGANGKPEALQDDTYLITDNWTHHVGYAQDWEFTTENHEKVLCWSIQTMSRSGEMCLDFFAGSGTAQSTAQKLGRKWLGVEMGEHFDAVILPRMKAVLAGHQSGISEETEYKGGGFFKYGEFEQYEETLKNAAYKDSNVSMFDASKSVFEQYPFLTDEKFSRAVKRNNEKLEIDFGALYGGIDIAESLANILGKQIKARDADSVTFVDGETRKTNPAKMSEKEKVEFIRDIRPYIWWGE